MNKHQLLQSFREKFCKTKVCKCCGYEKCDYSTTGCPWYVDGFILDAMGHKLSVAEEIEQWLESAFKEIESKAYNRGFCEGVKAQQDVIEKEYQASLKGQNEKE